jgi:hypothetical protein
MARILSYRQRLRLLCVPATATAIALTLVLAHGFSARGQTVAHASSSSHSNFKVKVANTDFGSDGAKGHFSAKLSAAGRVAAYVAAAVTGVPYPQIAQGGTYLAKVDGNGGIAMVTFSHRSLGTACVKYSARAGKYNPAQGYLPVTGSMTMIGGTGDAARWKGTIKFKQTDLTGMDTLVFDGSAVGSTRARHGLTAACKAVAKLKH